MISSALRKLPIVLALISLPHAALFSGVTYVDLNGSGTSTAHNAINFTGLNTTYYGTSTQLSIGSSSGYNDVLVSNGADLLCLLIRNSNRLTS
jgi:hypothetical protein